MVTAHVMIFFPKLWIGLIGFAISIFLRIAYGEGDFERN
jgi:hypothetical protein